MNKSVVFAIGLTALAGLTVPASAADLGRPPYPAPVAAPFSGLNWNGFYVGVGLGGRWTDTDWTTTCLAPVAGVCAAPDAFGARFGIDNPAAFNTSGFRVSGYVGYNWQVANWVLGIEGDFAYGDNQKTLTGIPGAHLLGLTANDFASIRDRWDASIRGRLGFLVTPQALFYVTGGATWLDKEVTAACFAPSFAAGGWCVLPPHAESVSKTLFGWTIGGGLDWMFLPAWVARAEYRYSDYTGDALGARFFAGTPIDTFDAIVEQKTHTAYLGLSYLFNWSGPRY
jgi:outer membrane immunogenic protein